MSETGEAGFLDHLDALRRSLWRMVAALALVFPFAWHFSGDAIALLVAYALPPEHPQLYFFTPMEAFLTELKVALVLSLTVTFPWNLWQLWRFLAPALYAHERRFLWRWLGAATVLFLGGAAFAVGAIFPLVMRFAYSFSRPSLQPMIGFESFVSLAGLMALAFGFMFQFPLAVLALTRTGLVRPETFRRGRPVVLVAILILAAVLTPPDLASQILLATPTYLLFELALLLAGRSKPRPEPEASPAEPPAVLPEPDPMLNYYRTEAERPGAEKKKKKKKRKS